MKKKIIIPIVILIFLISAGIGFAVGTKNATFFSIIDKTKNTLTQINPFKAKTVEEQIVSSEEELTPSSFGEAFEELTQPISEAQPESLASPIISGLVVPQPEKPLTLAEIEAQVKDISQKVNILTLELKKFVIEKEIQKVKFSAIQEQLSNIQGKTSTLSQEVAQFIATTPQVAGATTATPFTGGPTP